MAMYNYQEIKPQLFTEENQKLFLRIRDNVMVLLKQHKLVLMEDAINVQCSDAWLACACVDRLVELGEITERQTVNSTLQHRIFIKS